MEPILSDSRAAREKASSESKLSYLSDNSKNKANSRNNREEIDRDHFKQARRNTRYHHSNSKEIVNEERWTNDASNDESEDNDEEKNSENGTKNEDRYKSESLEYKLRESEERNNNVNIHRRHNDQSRTLSSHGIDDEHRIKKNSHGKDNIDIKNKREIDITDTPLSPLPSPSAGNQGSSVVDAVAGTSASVAVNSFLKFSIQNILQVRK